MATAALVLVLLIVIYLADLLVDPFLSLLLAELTTRGLGHLIADAGVTVTGQSGGILPVLVFGAGTDYALLVVRATARSCAATRTSTTRPAWRCAARAPSILASGATVMAALLTLSLSPR